MVAIGTQTPPLNSFMKYGNNVTHSASLIFMNQYEITGYQGTLKVSANALKYIKKFCGYGTCINYTQWIIDIIQLVLPNKINFFLFCYFFVVHFSNTFSG